MEQLVELQLLEINTVLEKERKHQIEYLKENEEEYDTPDMGSLVLVYTDI